MTPSRPDVVRLLRDLSPASVEECVWPGGMRLEISAYLTDQLPPADLVSSVRSLLFRVGAVMLMTSKDGNPHVLPGGRCEPGELMEETLQRELEEETGWRARAPMLLGFLHLNHYDLWLLQVKTFVGTSGMQDADHRHRTRVGPAQLNGKAQHSDATDV